LTTGRTTARRDALVVTGAALLARLVVVAWAAGSIPPTADGSYYHVVAQRIAQGAGYTWLWPDGVVTYAAHYPVGYPAALGLAYAVFGARPVVAMLVNVALGGAGSWGVHALLSRATSQRLALVGGIVYALHPALVPYTAALMTEGAAASLLVVAAAFAVRAREESRAPRTRRGAWATRSRVAVVACGVFMGLATLVRPQLVALAPVLGWLVARAPTWPARLRSAVAVLVVALAVCAPWTARNCVRMEKCALVSVNGGWNLAIGTQTTDGGWHEMKVPDACREVFAEAAKDACFGRAALADIAAHPGAWLARAPAKLRQTFDYFGAAPWYLHAANPERFPYRAKVALGAVETLVSRMLLAAALVTVVRLRGPRPFARKVVCVGGLVACVLVPGVLGYLACALGIVLLGFRALERAPVVVSATAAVILATAATHAVFFGAGRYGLVVVPFVTALAFVRPHAVHATATPSASGA